MSNGKVLVLGTEGTDGFNSKIQDQIKAREDAEQQAAEAAAEAEAEAVAAAEKREKRLSAEVELEEQGYGNVAQRALQDLQWEKYNGNTSLKRARGSKKKKTKKRHRKKKKTKKRHRKKKKAKRRSSVSRRAQ